MKGKRILVIGGNGFIGTNLCRHFISKGNYVSSFDKQMPTTKEANIEYIKGDFFNDVDLLGAVEGKDVVIHALSTISPGNSNTAYMQGYTRDFIQSIKLFDSISQRGSKLIFLSSGGTVYGNQKIQPIKEEQIAVPFNHYGTVKLCIESVIRTFNAQVHTKMLIARISNPYGPGQDYESSGVGFIDAAVKKTLRKETIQIWGDGNIIRDYIYIDDVCEMIEALVNYDGGIEVFNVSSNQGISQNDVILTLKNLGLIPEVIYGDKRNVDANKIILDNQKIRKIYKKEMTTFETGIAKYINYLKQMNYGNNI